MESEEMARYVREVVLNKPEDFVQFIMNDYLQKNGFGSSSHLWRRMGSGGVCRISAKEALQRKLRAAIWNLVAASAAGTADAAGLSNPGPDDG